MKAGETLTIETTDPLATIDVPAFCQEDGHRLVETLAIGGGHRFVIEKS